MEGLVVKSTGKWLRLKDQAGNVLPARIRGKLKLLDIPHTNPVAVGDRVSYILSDTGEALVETILERKNYVIRKAIKASKRTHIIAANIDLACLVISLKSPCTPLGFIDRFLVSSNAFRIPTIIVLNKSDLYIGDEWDTLIKGFSADYALAGYQVLGVSTKTKEGIKDLEKLLNGKISLFSGQSGVGKSSLANTLDDTFTLSTKNVSKYNEKGVHTTTFAEMYEWTFGGYLIDTPGIKEFGIVEVEKDELQDYFPEILMHKDKCKFNNCLHLNEPSCNVKIAFDKGLIAQSRYESYLNLLEECD